MDGVSPFNHWCSGNEQFRIIGVQRRDALRITALKCLR
jgi:hypothetical protein